MDARSVRRVLVVLGSVLVLVLSFAPAAFAGEDDETETTGGGDTGGAAGGVGTGAGGTASTTDGSMMLPFALGVGGVLVLTAAGGLALRRRTNE